MLYRSQFHTKGDFGRIPSLSNKMNKVGFQNLLRAGLELDAPVVDPEGRSERIILSDGRQFKSRQALSVVLGSLDVSLQLLRRRNRDDLVKGVCKVL